jgi:hypothetical protein
VNTHPKRGRTSGYSFFLQVNAFFSSQVRVGGGGSDVLSKAIPELAL